MSTTRTNVLSLLLFSGVRAAVYEGRLRKNAVLEPSAPIISEPPEFVAKGFLETQGSKTLANVLQHPKRAKARRDVVAIKEKCHQSCGSVLESGCAAECQVKTFDCLDYDRATKVGADTYQQCERASLTKYEKYSQRWESTHPRLSNLLAKKGREHFNGAVVDSLQDQCRDACGQGVDSSCVPECQVDMYQCLDFDKKTPDGLKKYEACEKVVMDKYKSFAADWDATHPYLMAVGRHVGAKHLQLVRNMCESGCKHNSGGSCIPRCEVSSYSCFSSDDSQVSGDTNLETCIGKVISQTSKGGADLKVTASQLKDIETACSNNCGLGADHSCLPECQVQMYACSGEDEPHKQASVKTRDYSTCTRSVLARYEKFSFDWNTAHPYLLNVRGHADASDLDDLHESCEDACGPNVDSSCVPECHVKVYACLDEKHPNDASPYKKCVRDVLASYERFADDWDAAHPFLLAVRRHVSETELLRALDKCQAACGKGVDSSCVPECQVEMYTCLDHDRKTPDGAKLYDECEGKVMAQYKKFGANRDAVHPY